MPNHITTAVLQVDSAGGMVPAGGTLTIAGGATPQSADGSFNDDFGNDNGVWAYNEIVIDTDGNASDPLFLANPANHAFGEARYVGTIVQDGVTYPILHSGASSNGHFILFHDVPGTTGAQAAAAFQADNGSTPFSINSSNFTECFASGTKISTADGDVKVEDLNIGDMVLKSDGGETKILWIGYQDVFPIYAGERDQPVRIRAGALGNNLPSEDLIVTADHALVVDGFLINASVLVNHDTIDFVSAAELQMLRVYHVETENHDVILANGCATESYLPSRARSAFANYQEYLDLYNGAERFVPEMQRLRISSRRLLPDAIQARLGIGTMVCELELTA